MAYIPSGYFPGGYFPPLYFAGGGDTPPPDPEPFELPFGAKYVYKALGLDIPTTEEEAEESGFPPEMFTDELTVNAALLIADYPCIVTNGVVNLTGTDLLMFEMAVGYATADQIQAGQAGAPGVAGPQLIKRKILDLEYTWKDKSSQESATQWSAIVQRMMAGIECVRNGRSGIGPGLYRVVNPQIDSQGFLVDNRGRRF